MKKILIAIYLLAASSVSFAQNLQSGYFTDGYLYRHNLNPAFGNDKGYVSMPALGNLNVSTEGNVGLKTFLYNVNGRTATFLHPSVSVDEFLGNIKDNNKLHESLKLQLLGAGFKSFGGYSTIEINVRENAGVVVPGSILRAMKEGLQNASYDLSSLCSDGNVYGEIALGHSHQVNDKLRVGGKVKVLLGLASESVKVKSGQLTLGEDSYTANVDAEMSISSKDIVFSHEVNEDTGHRYVNGVENGELGLNGFGLAVDLGAEYRLDDAWSFSVALLDLGFVNYKNSFVASTKGLKTFNTDKYTFNVDGEAVNSFENEFNKIKDDLSALYELEDMGNQGSSNRGLASTVNVGVKYTLPTYNKLNFGLLWSSRLYGKHTATTARLSANIVPAKIFSAGVNISAGTYGVGLGWILDFHPKGFGLFIGMDHVLGSLAKQGIPLNSNSNIAMGVNFPF